MQSVRGLIPTSISKQARLLENLSRIIRASLPKNCQDHVSVAGIKDQQLILITDSPVWSSRLRLYTQNMTEMLAEHAKLQINRIQIRQSQPGSPPREEPIKKFRHLSESSARLISQTANSIDDENLSNALQRLAKNRAK